VREYSKLSLVGSDRYTSFFCISDLIYNYIIIIIINQSQYNYVNALNNLKLHTFNYSEPSPKQDSVT
jgi:hypothetical protein